MIRAKSRVAETRDERPFKRYVNIVLAIGIIGLGLAMVELTLRYFDRPATIVSGWRITTAAGPVNQLGWRGRIWQHLPSDFVVVLVGGGAVECVLCPPDETMDVILERALRPFNPAARVIALGSRGYGQDQEFLALQQYLAHDRADLVVVWPSVAEDVPRNTFHSGQPHPGIWVPKPTFILRDGKLRGPTEQLGQAVYKTKLSILLRAPFEDLDRRWNALLPPATAGSASPPADTESRVHVDENLEEQRSRWSIWLNPPTPRTRYGIALTRALLMQMRDLATLHGARFSVLLTRDAGDPAPGGQTAGSQSAGNQTGGNQTGGNQTGGNQTGGNRTGASLTGGSHTAGNEAAGNQSIGNQPAGRQPVEIKADTRFALEHGGHWFNADPATRDTAIAAVTGSFDPITVGPIATGPITTDPSTTGRASDAPATPEAERLIMAQLADNLNQRNLLGPRSARIRR